MLLSPWGCNIPFYCIIKLINVTLFHKVHFRLEVPPPQRKKKLAPSSILREAKIAYYARNIFEAGRFFFRKGNVTSRHEPATLISWSLPRQRDVTPYRSPGCADVLRVARADVTDFSYMTLMDTSAVKHNMLKITH